MVSVTLPKPAPKPTLPQHDRDREARADRLAAAREAYVLRRLPLPAQCTPPSQMTAPLLVNVPESERFDNKYEFERGAATVPLVRNQELLERAAGQRDPMDALGPFGSLSEYEDLYLALPTPDVISDWLTDQSFGEQRLSGFNPGTLRRVDDAWWPAKLDRAALEQALDGSGIDLGTLIAQRRLFAVDNSDILAGIAGGTIEIPLPGQTITRQKYLPRPIALFAWCTEGVEQRQHHDKTGQLLPIAIQVDLDDHGAARVLTPRDTPTLWTIAKLCFSMAEANVHEMAKHLGRCHFALESFAAITPRELDETHPLRILLGPHLRFVLWNNQQGVERLVQVDGPVDLLMGGSLQESVKVALTAASDWSMTRNFERDLAERGVDDSDTLPHYPYRDDGLLIWQAIKQYVGEYLAIYYRCSSDITGDPELQAWAAALASTEPEGGGFVGDMPSSIDDLEQLVDIVTMIVFSSSAEHSALNFPQYPYMGFVPNAPSAGFADYRAHLANRDASEQEHVEFLTDFLPPKFVTLTQIALTTSLSMYHYDRLGEAQAMPADPLARQAAYRFRKALQAIEQRIRRRNRARLVPYTYLLPSQVLNSASI